MSARTVAAYRGWERRRENEDRVAVNIEPHLLPLWRRVKGQIKGLTPHARFECFVRYAEEHPSEALEALAEDAAFAVPTSTPAEDAAELVSSGAIQVAPGVWSLEPRALYALAWEAGDGAALVFQLPPDVDAFPPEPTEVLVDATRILDAGEDVPPDAWAVDVTAEGLTVHAFGHGMRLTGSAGDVRAVAPMPAELPEPAAPVYCDAAAE